MRKLPLPGNRQGRAVTKYGWLGVMAVGLMPTGPVQAQEALPALELPDTAGDEVKTLDEVRALKPEDDQPLDLYRFRNPIRVESNRFSRSWSEPPTPEQVSMSGGYIFLGINYGLMAAGKGVHKLTGGRDQIQSALARPPPLSEDQLRRAAENCEGPDCDVDRQGEE